MTRSIFYTLLFFSFLIACNSTAETETKTTTTVAKTTENDLGLPPIYEKYKDLEYIFEQKNDTTYIINFWATWCAPCVAELPYFEALNQKYANEKVKVKLVSLDFKKQLEKKLKPFLEKNNLQSEVMVLLDPDTNSWVDKVSPEWSGAIPATVIYKGDKRGFYEQSFEDLEELEAVMKQYF